MSVFFEIDGPYRCMLIPSSTTEVKMLKKEPVVVQKESKEQKETREKYKRETRELITQLRRIRSW